MLLLDVRFDTRIIDNTHTGDTIASIEFCWLLNFTVPAHPYVITTKDAYAGANLVLPLTGHNLSIDTRNWDFGI